MVSKQKSGTRALQIHNWQLLSAYLDTATQYYRCVTELLADWTGERTKFNFLQ